MIQYTSMKFEGPRPPPDTQGSEPLLSQLQTSCHRPPVTTFERWYREFNTLVVRVVHAKVHDHHSAEDIIQDIWLKVEKSLNHFDPARARPATFLSQIIRSCIVDFHRKRQAQIRIPPNNLVQYWDNDQRDDLRLPVAGSERPHLNLENRDFCDNYLKALPPKYRLVIEAYYFEQVPMDRIAAQLGISISAAHSILTQGRKYLYLLITGNPRPKSETRGRRSRNSPPAQEQDTRK